MVFACGVPSSSGSSSRSEASRDVAANVGSAVNSDAAATLTTLLPKRKPSQKPKPKPKTSTTPQAERPQRCLQVGAPHRLPPTLHPHTTLRPQTLHRAEGGEKKSAQFWRSQHLSEDCLEQRLEGAERKREDGEASSCKDQGVVGCRKGGRLKEEKSTT